MLQRVSLSQCCGCFIMLASSAVGAVASAAELSGCQPLQLQATEGFSSARKPPHTNTVEMQLTPGQLEPQIRRLLREHLAIKVLDWQASPHHQWPTEHTVNAASWAEVLRRVLQPYHLQLVMHPNHSAVVRYRNPS